MTNTKQFNIIKIINVFYCECVGLLSRNERATCETSSRSIQREVGGEAGRVCVHQSPKGEGIKCEPMQ